MFVKGDADLDFGKVAEVIDMGHQADVDNIGLITRASPRASNKISPLAAGSFAESQRLVT